MRHFVPKASLQGWNDASFWSAIVVFGPLSIPVHFARTRRSVLGLVIGVFWAGLVMGVIGVVSWFSEFLFRSASLVARASLPIREAAGAWLRLVFFVTLRFRASRRFRS